MEDISDRIAVAINANVNAVIYPTSASVTPCLVRLRVCRIAAVGFAAGEWAVSIARPGGHATKKSVGLIGLASSRAGCDSQSWQVGFNRKGPPSRLLARQRLLRNHGQHYAQTSCISCPERVKMACFCSS